VSDRYRKVRRALRRVEQEVKRIEESMPNRKARRAAFYSDEMKALVSKVADAKREVAR
jgi:hypothetical protein